VGETLATLVNYACHPVVMGPLNLYITADWVGEMRVRVEESLGGMCLFIQGATGDVNPRKMRWTADNWDEMEDQGGEVAAAVVRAAAGSTPLNSGRLITRQELQWLRLMPRRFTSLKMFYPDAASDEEARARARAAFPWRGDTEQRDDSIYSPVQMSVLRVGDWALIGLGTEPFAETGLAIKAESPAKMTFVAGYTNGCNSYLPCSSAYESGGYEVETAPIFYGLPAGFERGSAERVVARALRLVE
jgi:hypothetical protein